MSAREETLALIALLRLSDRPTAHIADAVEAAGSARPMLERALLHDAARPADQPQRLFDAAPPTPARRANAGELLAAAERDLEAWHARGIGVRTVLDSQYPPNLRAAHHRPPLLFVRGESGAEQAQCAIAVVGSRHASVAGLRLAGDISTRLAALNYVVVSGLASGIDTAAHQAALAAGALTVAAIGTGLDHAYPRENARLQHTIAARGAVVSQFWPEATPRRDHFPQRNALMSGLTRATLIVEAGPRSGTRIAAKAALEQGRPVLVHKTLLEQPWARGLAERANVHVVVKADEAVALVERLHRADLLSG